MRTWLAIIGIYALFVISACGLAPSATAPLRTDGVLLSDQSPNPRAYGNPDAPVKISEFSDFQ